MNITESFISVFTNWKNFHGRACRSEYWYFYLSVILISFVLGFVEGFVGVFNDEVGYGPLSLLFQIIIIFPSFKVKIVTSLKIIVFPLPGWLPLIARVTIILLPASISSSIFSS